MTPIPASEHLRRVLAGQETTDPVLLAAWAKGTLEERDRLVKALDIERARTASAEKLLAANTAQHPQDGPQPHAERPQPPSGQPEPSHASSSPQRGAGDAEPEPHLVTVTHLPGGFDMNDRQPYEQLIGNGVTGWASHLVQHPAACHHLPYGTQCPFDDEWHNVQYTYDDIQPGLYRVLPARHDVGDHHGEYSHTEDYLDYQRIGDAPERPAPAAADSGRYSQEPPF